MTKSELLEQLNQLENKALYNAFLFKSEAEINDNLFNIFHYLEDLRMRKEKDYVTNYRIDKQTGKITWFLVPSSPKAKEKEKLRLIKQNFLTPLNSDNQYFFSLKRNIDWTYSNRKELLLRLKTKQGLWIHGSVGIGKTYITISILNEAASKNKKVAYMPMIYLASTFPQTSTNYFANLTDFLTPYKTADVLVIDDLGAEKTTQWIRDAILLPVIDYRLINNKKTFITSNMSIKKYGAKIKLSSDNSSDNLRLIDRIESLVSEFNLQGTSQRAKNNTYGK